MDEAVIENDQTPKSDELDKLDKGELINIILDQRKIISDQNAEMTHSDKIPTLLNNKGFVAAALADIDHARRTGEDLSLVYMDANKFKNVNDTYGRKVGNEAIIAIGESLSEKRVSDKAGHLSGDEFVVLALSTNKGGAEIIAGRLRLNANEALAKFSNENLFPSLSFGIAQMGEMPIFKEPDPESKNRDKIVVGVKKTDIADYNNVSNMDLYEGMLAVAEYRMKKDKIYNGDGIRV